MIGSSRGGHDGLPAINHAEAEALISARLDVALDSRQEQILEKHLASCPNCRLFAAQMDAMQGGMRELPRLPASPIVSRQVRERIRQPQSIADRLGGLFGSRLGVAPVAAMAAVLVMLVGAYALFGNDSENGRLGPTISAGTQIADNSTTNTAIVETETTSQAAYPTGQIIENTPAPTVPSFQFDEETPTEEPTETVEPTETDVPPAPTETDVPTEVPTDEPTETETPTEEPTSTPEPTETEIPTEEPTETAEPTETDEPTEEPTATEVPTETPEPEPTETDEPTATETEEPTAELTATEEPTDEPTATDEPTEEPTATEKPTEEPTATDEPEDEPTSTQPPIVPLDETPVEEFTDEPIDEATLEDPTEEITEEPTSDPSQIELVDPTEDEAGDATEVGGPTGEGDDPQGGDEPVELPLDNTRKITDISSDGAPTGPLLVNTPVTMMVLTSGGAHEVVGVTDGEIYARLGAAAYPIWSPLGMVLLYQDLNNGTPAAALYDGELGEVYSISDPAEDGAVADIPAGWAGSSAYYLRIAGDEANTVILYAYDVNTAETLEIWRSENVILAGGRPIPTGNGFLIATAASWLLVTTDGSEFNQGPADYGLAGEGFLNPAASMIAYPTGSDLVIASVDSPGIPMGFIPYSGGPGSGFSWSPDGSYVVVSDGASLSIYDTSGEFLGSAESATGVAIAAPQWLDDGIYYVEIAPTPSLRRILVENIPGFGG